MFQKGHNWTCSVQTKVEERQLVDVTARSTLGRYSKGFMPRVKRGGFVLQRATKLANAR